MRMGRTVEPSNRRTKISRSLQEYEGCLSAAITPLTDKVLSTLLERRMRYMSEVVMIVKPSGTKIHQNSREDVTLNHAKL